MATYATYNAPDGDDQVVTMQGVRFFDGQNTKLDETKDALLIEKLRSNQHFDLDEGDTDANDQTSGEGNEVHKTGW